MRGRRHYSQVSLAVTVEVADQAWATQLRFLEKDLLHTLHQHFGDAIESIDIRVRRYR
jgi:hypothetical protein